MSVSLKKGSSIVLQKSITNYKIGLGWKESDKRGIKFDLDASLFILGVDGKVRSDADFIFYNQKEGLNGKIKHLGDNKVGGKNDDDQETILANLDDVPANVSSLMITVTIHEFEARKQNFGMVKGAYIRLVDEKAGTEILRYDLSEEITTASGMIFAEISRNESNPNIWSFRSVGTSITNGLAGAATLYGVNIE